MGLDDLLISTGVDQLIKLVRERGKVEIGQAARELSLPLRTVEDWAHVLEEEGLIGVEYKLTKVYLAWKSLSPEYVAKKSEKLQAKAGQTKQEIDALLSKVQQGEKELTEMQNEITSAKNAAAMTPQDVQALKSELARLSQEQEAAVGEASGRLEKLRKKVAAFGSKSGLEKESKKAGADELAGALEVLGKFETALKEQLASNEDMFGAFEARSEEMRRKVEGGEYGEEIKEMKSELGEIESLKTELAGAIEAVSEEQKELGEKVEALRGQFASIMGKDGSPGKRQLAELAKMEADAKRQKAAVAAQLDEALIMVKKQQATFEAIAQKQGKTMGAMEELKNEYVDISEEVSRANDALLSRQKEISRVIASQMAALEIIKGGSPGISRDELQKASFLLAELKREQSMLEQSVKVLLKEFEIIRPEGGAPQQGSATSRATGAAKGEGAPSFVEKVKLSQEEENEFERKREELRALIRRMWEEGKGGSHS
jgi:chromosome segregation ATPase